MSVGYVSRMAASEDTYATDHREKPLFSPLKVSKIPKDVPRNIATPNIEIELPLYRDLIPLFLIVSSMLPMMVLFAPEMFMDRWFRACSRGYKIARDIHEPRTPEIKFVPRLDPAAKIPEETRDSLVDYFEKKLTV